MSTPLLATKLYIPPPRPNVVLRPRLVERLNEGRQRKLTLISAPAGFGKTTLLAEWLAERQKAKGKRQNHSDETLLPSTFFLLPSQVAWLSLDEDDNDPARFLAYLVAALQTIAATIGAGLAAALQSPQPPPTEAILTALLNDITAVPDHFTLVFDDYHVIDAKPVDAALTFLLKHLPPQMHLIIATRENPPLPLARLRARGQLTELRSADLRFTLSEAADFLNQVMGLSLSTEDIAALETRTEGWIAGLQLAAISIQGNKDPKRFITSFSGNHRYVLDYLIEEVLEQQSESVQTFMLQTAILDRMCGSLCDAVLGMRDQGLASEPPPPDPRPLNRGSQATLEYLERANLFIVPLDDERRWYRYHHLFADLLRQRLHQSAASSPGNAGPGVAELHRRASVWYEDHGLELEAFHHAAAANDVERATRLMEGKRVPLYFRGAMVPVRQWLASLPTTVLDARPSLWVAYASALTMLGQPIGSVEEKLQAAEAALQGAEPDHKTQDLLGHIAALRAMLAIPQHQVETLIAQSRRALEFLHPDNLPLRTSATWTLGFAYQLQGDRAAASRAYTEVIALSQASGNSMVTIAATTLLGWVQAADNQLYLAAESYRRVLHLAGEPPWPAACEAQLGLAGLCYEWNDLDAARQHGQQSLQLARQLETVDTPAVCQVFLARLKLAEGDVGGAAALVAQAEQFMRQQSFVHRMPDVVAAQVLILLRQGQPAAAARLIEKHELPLSQARVYLAQADPPAALAVLQRWRDQVEAKGWQDERLKALVLLAVAHHARGEAELAMDALAEALALAEPGGFCRTFVDEGPPMAALLQQGLARGITPGYVEKLLAAFPKELRMEHEELRKTPTSNSQFSMLNAQLLVEPLSERELEVLRLLGTELSGPEIARELLVSLNTMRTHTKNIYTKLGVSNRRAAVRRAEELDLF